MKIHPVGAELYHADGWTDRETDKHDEANSRFLQFCERANCVRLFTDTMRHMGASVEKYA